MGGLLIYQQFVFVVKNLITWFEIPAVNFDRPVPFYSTISEIEMEKIKSGDYSMTLCPQEKDDKTVLVVSGNGAIASEKVPLIYLQGIWDSNKILHEVNEICDRIIHSKSFLIPLLDTMRFFSIGKGLN